jgi:protein involved in polysaccharide export with SLBB domain
MGSRRKVSHCPLAALGVFLLPLLLTGCVAGRGNVDKKLLAQPPREEPLHIAHAYHVHCPDIIAVRVMNHPEYQWRVAVDVDGSLPIEQLARPRVEGRTVAEMGKIVATRLGISEQNVVVEVTDYRSKQLYIFGQVKGSAQAVSYRGPETVLEVLQRVGGLTKGAEPRDVYVIRAHVDDGKRPEVYHVDLNAIVAKNDHSTNIRLEPFDQVHVGESPQALVERCIPPWMRPVHWAIWDSRPEERVQRGSWRSWFKRAENKSSDPSGP